MIIEIKTHKVTESIPVFSDDQKNCIGEESSSREIKIAYLTPEMDNDIQFIENQSNEKFKPGNRMAMPLNLYESKKNLNTV